MRALGPDDPRAVGAYRILRVLGAGGMGRVYVGRSHTGRAVAIKVIQPLLAGDPAFRARFRREVEAARRVAGAWTAPVLDADPEAEQPWLVTGFVPGLTLGEAVVARGPLPAASVRELGIGLATALTSVHRAGLVHRDLKPSNVMLSPDGPRVIDFGISRAADASALTGTGSTVGSPGFMAPEQIEGRDIAPATDVFALGAVLTYAATGTGPFGEGNSQAMIFRVLAQEPQLEAVPEELRPLVAACLAKRPQERPAPEDVRRALAPDRDAEAPVAVGWLPPDLAQDVSRRAVELLELEDEDAGPTAPFAAGSAGGSGPYGAGRFSATPNTAGTGDAGRLGQAAYGYDAPPGAGPTAPATRPPNAWTHAVSPGFEPPPAPATDTKRRLLLPVAAAVLVAVIAAGIAVLLTRDGDGGDKAEKGSTTSGPTAGGPTPTGATPTDRTPTAPPPTGQGALPEGFVGSWAGNVTTQSGSLTQQMTVTLKAGKTGDVVGSTQTVAVGVTCSSAVRLSAVSASTAQIADVPDGAGNSILCTSDGQTTLQLLSDGRLQVTITGTGSGNPTGVLTKS